MTKNTTEVVEIAQFKLSSDASAESVRGSASEVDAWLRAQPGFVSRTLMGPDDDGRYLDLVRWRSSSEAKEAGERFVAAAETCEFMGLIDPASVEMRHLPILLDFAVS